MSENYEMVNHPSHYNKYDVEVIDMMEKIWGTEAVALWAEMTAFKYRMRLGEKPENPIEQDLNKETWYLNKSKEYKEKLDAMKIRDISDKPSYENVLNEEN